MNAVVQKQFDKIKGLHTITFHTEGQRLPVCGNYQLTFSNKGDISLHLGNRFPGPAFTLGQVILIARELVVDLKMITLHPQSIVEGADECHAPDVTAMIDDLKSFCSQVNDYFIQSAVRHFALNKLLCYVSEGCVAVNTSPITKIPYALLIDMEAGSPPWYSHPPQVL